MSNDNLSDSLTKLINSCFIRYSGCLIEKTSSGFIVFGKEYPTLDEAKKKIDNSFSNIQNSIK